MFLNTKKLCRQQWSRINYQLADTEALHGPIPLEINQFAVSAVA
jgi:hypothetical protein